MSLAPRRYLMLGLATVVLATASLGTASAAFGDAWGQDHAVARQVQQLDPAIRTAIAAHSVVPVPVAAVAVAAPVADAGFAWGAAALGAAAGALALAALLACVTLVRHDARLRSA
jgi:hypothetical protein